MIVLSSDSAAPRSLWLASTAESPSAVLHVSLTRQSHSVGRPGRGLVDGPFPTSHWPRRTLRPKAVSSRSLVVRRLSHGHGFRTRGDGPWQGAVALSCGGHD